MAKYFKTAQSQLAVEPYSPEKMFLHEKELEDTNAAEGRQARRRESSSYRNKKAGFEIFPEQRWSFS